MQPPGVSYSQARTHSASRRLSQLSWKFPYQFRVLALSVPGKRTSAVFHHLDPPVSQGWRFALHPPFSWAKEVTDFLFVACFPHCKDGGHKAQSIFMIKNLLET